MTEKVWSKPQLADVLMRFVCVVLLVGSETWLASALTWEHFKGLSYTFIGMGGAAVLACIVLLTKAIIKRDLTGLL